MEERVSLDGGLLSGTGGAERSGLSYWERDCKIAWRCKEDKLVAILALRSTGTGKADDWKLAW